MYAIMGITGRVGGAIAENLLAQGEKFARSFGILKEPHVGGIVEQQLRLQTSTIRMR